MKRALILAAAAAVLCSCASKNQFVIEGNVAGTNDVVYLLDKKRTPLDSWPTWPMPVTCRAPSPRW